MSKFKFNKNQIRKINTYDYDTCLKALSVYDEASLRKGKIEYPEAYLLAILDKLSQDYYKEYVKSEQYVNKRIEIDNSVKVRLPTYCFNGSMFYGYQKVFQYLFPLFCEKPIVIMSLKDIEELTNLDSGDISTSLGILAIRGYIYVSKPATSKTRIYEINPFMFTSEGKKLLFSIFRVLYIK